MFLPGMGLSPMGRAPRYARGFDLYANFQDRLYYESRAVSAPTFEAGEIVDTHPQSILVQSSTGYSSVGVDVLSRSDLGLQTVPSRTNLFARSAEFANATWSKVRCTVSSGAVTGPIGSSDKIVDDTTASATHATLQSATVTAGSTTFSVIAKYAGRNIRLQIPTTATGAGDKFVDFDLQNGVVYFSSSATSARITHLVDGWYLCEATVTTIAAAASMLIYLLNGFTQSYTGDGVSGVYIQHAQIEAGSFATPPIITTGSAVTRTGPRQVISGLDLTYGVAGFWKGDLRQPVGSEVIRFLNFSDGTETNRVTLGRASNGFVFLNSSTGGFAGSIAYASGQQTFAFAASDGFYRFRPVGGALMSGNEAGFPSGLNKVGVCGDGNGTTRNAYAFTEQLGLIYGTPSRPINQALFDQVYAQAVGA